MAPDPMTPVPGPDMSPSWQAAEVCLTGRLASMTHDEARTRLEALGCSTVARPTRRTAFLVVGRGGAPIDDEGRPTAALARARALIDDGQDLALVSEEELLEQLGLHDARADLERLYTIAQLARLLDVPSSRVRAWVRRGLLRPVRTRGRLGFFDFGQVSAAKTLRELTDRGVPPALIRRSLRELSSWMPERAGLSSLDVADDVVVRLPDGRLADPSGQLRLGFAPSTDRPRVAPVVSIARSSPADTTPSADPEVWFDRGVDAEADGRPADASHAYRQAVALDPDFVEAWFNLGNAEYDVDDRRAAAIAYERAVAIDPAYAEAWNNLGNVRGELGELTAAIDAYHRALAIEPTYADAHYNLADTLALLGDADGARRHWLAYLEQDPHSSDAAHIRARLERLGSGDAGDC